MVLTVPVFQGGRLITFLHAGDRQNGRSIGFNGHTDVVPIGDPSDWSVDPFGAVEKDGYLYGRGAVDMKSGVAAYVSAAIEGQQHPLMALLLL